MSTKVIDQYISIKELQSTEVDNSNYSPMTMISSSFCISLIVNKFFEFISLVMVIDVFFCVCQLYIESAYIDSDTALSDNIYIHIWTPTSIPLPCSFARAGNYYTCFSLKSSTVKGENYSI